SKKRKKKRGSEDKKSEEAGGNGAPKSAESDRNTVCPWEDDDPSIKTGSLLAAMFALKAIGTATNKDGSTSDTTFVKTYATFGYL
uniref:Uncharacterized protein n=1 Tax=Megaselia scalaris TaxID=36166 RepID=T1GDS3_MEGSC